MEPGTFDQNCLKVSKLMIRLLRHDNSVNREEDGVKNYIFFALLNSNMVQFLAKRRWN